MTSSDFSHLVQKFPLVESEYISGIEQQLLAAPYCQTLHLLLAKSGKDSNNPAATALIQRAALYASDRTHLKHLLESTTENRLSVSISEPKQIILSVADTQPVENPVTVSGKKQDQEIQKDKNESNSDIADVLMEDLGILKEKTAAFVELTSGKITIKPAATNQQTPAARPEVKPAPATPQVKQPKAADETDLLLLEIKSSRKKIKPENPRKAEQIEIIDQFIKARQVTIRPPEKAMPKQDLTESADSYSENVISETLVEILVRQGKKEKAVDVLRKLIWKFPQKKHLFAARIQELSK